MSYLFLTIMTGCHMIEHGYIQNTKERGTTYVFESTMSQVRKHKCPTVKCRKQAWLLLVSHVWLALFNLDSHQVVHRPHGFGLLGLVAGHH